MSKAVDTNVVVRLLIDDGSKQVAAARALFATGTIAISSSVILECEWVLRAVYKISPDAICGAFTALLNMDDVSVADADVVANATEAHRRGLDFADAFHLYSAAKSDELLTFDDDFAKRAKRLTNAIPVRLPEIQFEGGRP